VRTAGVDLAAEPAGTALAILEWDASRASLIDLKCGVTDDIIVSAAPGIQKIGIDCALGWPREFVEFLVQNDRVVQTPNVLDGGMEWRRHLAYRETDRQTREVTGRWPLSVATDRLGVTALRAAGLLSRLAAAGVDVDRSGQGSVVEVYPGASLRLWSLHTVGYKTSKDAREMLLRALHAAAPWLDLGDWAELMVDSSDAFDAVIAALAARSAALGLSTAPTEEHREQAQVEGWIALPTSPLGSLIESDEHRSKT
jgi:predicted nuclease with RNAse H fold